MRTRALAAACVLAVLAPAGAAAQPDPSRPLVGLALGGGGARGLAHVGVLRYLEEHHIPVHVVAGTSIGGLIGAGFASGMSAAELEAFVTAIDWHAVLGGDLPYDARSFRRKQDRRDYPVRLDLGLRGGLRLPPGFDTGMQVELLLTRYLLPYYAITDFDALPTPFRCTAVDLDRAELVVFGEGDLPRALRATMSQPGIFDPVVIDGRRLADGGLLDNLPVDVARTAGADRVIAVMVEGPLLGPGPAVTALGVVAQSVDVMTLARTREQLAHADVRVQPPLEAFGPADWGRARALIEAGYEAARQAPGLLDLRVDAGSWRRYTEARAARRRVSVPAPTFVAVRGTTLDEQQRIVRLLRPHLGRPIDTRQLERDLTRIIGDRRYALATYRIVEEGGRPGLLVRVETPAHGPPFLHSAVGIRNRGSRRLDLNLGARLSAFDVAGNGSEARVDLAAGSRLAAAGELYLPLGHPRLFLATGGAAWRETGPFAAGVGTVDAREARLEGTVDLGVTSGRRHEARAGLRLSRVSLRDLSPPGAFDVEGVERAARVRWAYDGQDSPTIPSRGLHVTTELRYAFTHAGGDGRFGQAETELSWFVPVRRHRLFARVAGGTSFGDPVPPVHRFPFGGLFQVSAIERRAGAGSHVASASVGYLHRLGDLPPFLGGSLHLGAWLDAGSAFERRQDADLLAAASVGFLVDTPVGPVVLAGSLGEGGRSRVHILVGRLFR